MFALINVTYGDAFEYLHQWTHDTSKSGRMLAHAMAHGYYGSRPVVIVYSESSGTFTIVKPNSEGI